MTVPARGQDLASNAAPACAAITDSAKAIKCEIEQSQVRTEALKEDTARLKKEGDVAEAVTGCIQFLTAGVKTGAFAKAEILQKAGGKLNDQNACPVARQYGYGRKADASPAAYRSECRRPKRGLD